VYGLCVRFSIFLPEKVWFDAILLSAQVTVYLEKGSITVGI